MKKLILAMLGTLLLAACGGDNALTGSASSSSASNSSGASSSTATNTVASISVLASSPQLPSDNSAPVTITAYVFNAANQAMQGQTVVFQTDSGYLSGITSVTNANGIATATLNTLSSDPSNRTITVTGSTGTLTDTATVDVVGTQLAFSGSAALVYGDSATYTAILTNYGGVPLSNQTVTFASSRGNTLNKTTGQTNASGQVTVSMTGAVAGVDTLSATALGITTQQSVTVTNDSFVFSAPVAATEVGINRNAGSDCSTDTTTISGTTLSGATQVTVAWTVGGVAQSGSQITFSTTRGAFATTTNTAATSSSATATTNTSGQATVYICSTNAGPATLTATTSTGATTQVSIEFVATTAVSMNLQASPASIAPSGQSTVTAVVRDANNNLVKNKTVQFTLNDVTGGTLSLGSAVTDSQGRAQTIYTASTSTSAANGVSISASVSGSSASASTTLTVAQQSLFISLGTGNSISEPNSAQYSVEYAIQVTDANGNGVANQALTVRVVSLWYGTGRKTFGSSWNASYNDVCVDEDTLLGAGVTGYRNGILDAGEDFNGTGILEAGNVATVTPTAVTTDSKGFALINVYYPQEYSDWVKVQLSVSAQVSGTESTRSVSFILSAAASDVNNINNAPPGYISPFGEADYGCPTPATYP